LLTPPMPAHAATTLATTTGIQPATLSNEQPANVD